MKKNALFFVFSLIILAVTTKGVPTQPFSDWESLMQNSTDIVLVRCTRTPEPFAQDKDGMVQEPVDGIINSDIEVKLALKGGAETAVSTLTSQFKPCQAGEYLIFAKYYNGSFQAIEPYKVIPLGMNFPTNMLKDQSLLKQIQIVIKWRLDHLNRELSQMEAEKGRLEGGLTH